MNITVAKTAGFCFGVDRAVQIVDGLLDRQQRVCTLGPIIHNPQTLSRLAQRGVRVVETPQEVSAGEMLVIRSHGVAQAVFDEMESRAVQYVDATCPFVRRIHRIVEKESAAGKQILIIGNAGHPEVEGIMGWSVTPAIVAETKEEMSKIECDREKPVCIVSQTTFNYNKFQELVEIFKERGYDISIVNTICNATEERQTEAKEIAAEVDAMIVIGGKRSSNTRKLYEICSRECANTCFIQTLDDLHLELPKSVRLVGITAGASTPSKIIEEVQNYVRINF